MSNSEVISLSLSLSLSSKIVTCKVPASQLDSSFWTLPRIDLHPSFQGQ